MKKTAEEKWQAVVALINTKLEGVYHFEEDTEVGRWEFHWRGENMVGYKCSVILSANPDKARTIYTDLLVGLDWESARGHHTEQEVAVLYNLLGLDRLDAVGELELELYNLKLAIKDGNALRSVGTSYLYKVVDAERASSAKLVELVERTKSYCEQGNGCGGATLIDGKWFDEGDGTLYHAALVALAAHKKGGGDTKDSETRRLVTILGDYLNHRGVSIEAVKEQYSMLFPADGVVVSTKPDIETQPGDVMVVGNCANCGVEFHIHQQDPADGDGVEETRDENRLLPCPFCGGTKIDSEIISHRSHTIRCLGCNVVVFSENLDDALPRWNSRAGRGIEG